MSGRTSRCSNYGTVNEKDTCQIRVFITFGTDTPKPPAPSESVRVLLLSCATPRRAALAAAPSGENSLFPFKSRTLRNWHSLLLKKIMHLFSFKKEPKYNFRQYLLIIVRYILETDLFPPESYSHTPDAFYVLPHFIPHHKIVNQRPICKSFRH